MEGNTRQARHYALLRAAQSADAEEAAAATERLLLENMGLVRTAALRFRERGVEYEDLVQIGTVGMLRAIRTFDLARGTAFSTFAVPLIVGEIRRSLRDDGLLHVSRTYKQLAAELSGARQRDSGELGDRITDDESEHEPAILTDRLALREAIGKMPAMWRRILLLRYYRCRTQQETADLLGLSQVKVSREEKKILSFLRGEMIVS